MCYTNKSFICGEKEKEKNMLEILLGHQGQFCVWIKGNVPP